MKYSSAFDSGECLSCFLMIYVKIFIFIPYSVNPHCAIRFAGRMNSRDSPHMTSTLGWVNPKTEIARGGCFNFFSRTRLKEGPQI